MDQLVQWGDVVASPRQMLSDGLAEVVTEKAFKGSAKGQPRKAAFVQLKGTTRSVEVSGYVQQ